MGYPSTISCAKGQTILEQVAGMIGKDIFERDVAIDAYTNIVEQKPYDLSLGNNQRYTVMGPSRPFQAQLESVDANQRSGRHDPMRAAVHAD